MYMYNSVATSRFLFIVAPRGSCSRLAGCIHGKIVSLEGVKYAKAVSKYAEAEISKPIL